MSKLKMLVLSLATVSSLALIPAVGYTQDPIQGFAEGTADLSTSAAVKSRLLWNHSTSGLDINVTTENGVVTLEGLADSVEIRELAERLTADTNGVREVRNLLHVQPADIRVVESGRLAAGLSGDLEFEALGDAWITGKVKSLLLLTRGLAATGIEVSTRDGQVHLSGEVESAAIKQDTTDRVRNVRGVRQVDAGALKIDS